MKDLTLEGVQITTTHSEGNAGGVAGWSYGTLENCSVSGSVIGRGKNSIVGGGVGSQNGGFLTGCSSSATVNAGNAAGGVVGSNGPSSTLQACYAWGSVTGSGSGTIYAGGVTGTNDLGTLTACYHAKGTVSGPGGATGGVAGRNFKDSMFGGGIITACYWGDNGQEQGTMRVYLY